MKAANIPEWEELKSYLKSPAYRYVRNMYTLHRQYLQEQVNLQLKHHEDRKAGETLARMTEVIYLSEMVKNRVKELENPEEE